ncbi:MAG: SPOR domain-containing protein [Gammaproteobacteria bacterium]|nr:SPOR domain-containing protein [Gammaproteobacteria bacterium]
MARDYKHSRRRRGSSLPGWAWLLTGLAIGLFVAFLVYLKERVPPQALPELAGETGKATRRDTREVDKADQDAVPGPPRPKFDFYTILPEMEVVVPDSDVSDPRSPAGEATPEPSETYVLQAGSFKHYKEADRMKANLALLGIEADIQTVTINDGETWHRVRIGPFTERSSLQEVRARLRENDIEALLLKVKG